MKKLNMRKVVSNAFFLPKGKMTRAIITSSSAINRKGESRIKVVRSSTSLPFFLEEALIGIILGDGHLSKSSSTSNTRLELSMASTDIILAYYIYSLFIYYYNTKPKKLETKSKNNNKLYGSIRLKTLSLSVFNKYYDLFYKRDVKKNKWIKIIPENIHEYMTPVVLAFLIMGDGNFDKSRNRIRIYTNSFTHSENLLLAAAIIEKLNIKTSVMRDKNNQYILTIGAKQLKILQILISPYLHPSKLYRIGKNNYSV